MWRTLINLFMKWTFNRNADEAESDLEALMAEGWNAYETKAKCPYGKGTRQRKAWMRGWLEADHEKMMLW